MKTSILSLLVFSFFMMTQTLIGQQLEIQNATDYEATVNYYGQTIVVPANSNVTSTAAFACPPAVSVSLDLGACTRALPTPGAYGLNCSGRSFSIQWVSSTSVTSPFGSACNPPLADTGTIYIRPA